MTRDQEAITAIIKAVIFQQSAIATLRENLGEQFKSSDDLASLDGFIEMAMNKINDAIDLLEGVRHE